MLTFSPWDYRNDPLQSAESGARLGLQARGQDIDALDSGKRLRYSYDTLEAQQENERRRAAQVAAQTQASYSLRAQQQDAMTNYRNQQIEAQQERIRQAAEKTASAADSLKAAHDDTSGFVEDAQKLGAAEAYARHPNADKVVVNHVMSMEQEKSKAKGEGRDKSYVDVVNQDTPVHLMHFAPDDPTLNKIGLGTNASALGTNYVSRLNAPVTSGQQPSSPVRVKDKKTGQTLIYKGNPADIPADQYEVLQ